MRPTPAIDRSRVQPLASVRRQERERLGAGLDAITAAYKGLHAALAEPIRKLTERFKTFAAAAEAAGIKLPAGEYDKPVIRDLPPIVLRTRKPPAIPAHVGEQINGVANAFLLRELGPGPGRDR